MLSSSMKLKKDEGERSGKTGVGEGCGGVSRKERPGECGDDSREEEEGSLGEVEWKGSVAKSSVLKMSLKSVNGVWLSTSMVVVVKRPNWVTNKTKASLM